MSDGLNAIYERLALVEKEVASIRHELTDLDRLGTNHRTGALKALSRFQTDRDLLRRSMDGFLGELGIQAQPIDAENLQERMSKAGLMPDELSRDLIKAREE